MTVSKCYCFSLPRK